MALLPSDALSCQLPCKGVCTASLPLSPSHQHLPTPCQWQCFPQVTKSHIKLLLITTGPTVVTVGPGEGPATLDGHRSCPAAHPEGLPQGFNHTPLQRYGSHTKYSCLQSSCPAAAVTQKFPQKTLSSSTCLGYGATAGWCLHHLPCFKPHSAGKLKHRDQSSQDGVVENFIPPLRKAQASR